ncbi:hypothetical protein F4775DRAFT_4149 [Biscogniauxia sp. FL1348]|nr:hypothetical protein F4775DRAFT_4149 [Biscogniauxia sp. FL1348]
MQDIACLRDFTYPSNSPHLSAPHCTRGEPNPTQPPNQPRQSMGIPSTSIYAPSSSSSSSATEHICQAGRAGKIRHLVQRTAPCLLRPLALVCCLLLLLCLVALVVVALSRGRDERVVGMEMETGETGDREDEKWMLEFRRRKSEVLGVIEEDEHEVLLGDRRGGKAKAGLGGFMRRVMGGRTRDGASWAM